MAFIYEKYADNEEDFKKELFGKLKSDDYFEPSLVNPSAGCKGVFLKKGSIAYIEVYEKEEDKEDKEDKEVEVPKKFKDLVEKIEEMSVADLAELVEVLEDKFNVSATAAVAAAPAASAGGEEDGGGEKSAYDVILKGVGEKKIQVIKAVRNITGEGLKDSKALVDGVSDEPQVVKSNVKTEEAKELQKELEEAGAEVELK